jgi:hypothetical protein
MEAGMHIRNGLRIALLVSAGFLAGPTAWAQQALTVVPSVTQPSTASSSSRSEGEASGSVEAGRAKSEPSADSPTLTLSRQADAVEAGNAEDATTPRVRRVKTSRQN